MKSKIVVFLMLRGLAFSADRLGAKFYVESRYNRVFTSGSDTTYEPLTFELRW